MHNALCMYRIPRLRREHILTSINLLSFNKLSLAISVELTDEHFRCTISVSEKCKKKGQKEQKLKFEFRKMLKKCNTNAVKMSDGGQAVI